MFGISCQGQKKLIKSGNDLIDKVKKSENIFKFLFYFTLKMDIRVADCNDSKIIMGFQFELFKKWDAIDPIDKIDKPWFNSKQHLEQTIDTINDNSKKIFLAFEKDRCIGYIKAEIIKREPFLKKTGYISEEYILAESRGRKAGSLLLKKALAWFKENDIRWSTVSTHSKDQSAIKFWKKKGYSEYNKFFKIKI
jgi:GNAT superfamily N-acetyltransferase